MDADTEAAGYGESVRLAQEEVEFLRERLSDMWELVDELGSIADYSRLKSKTNRDTLRAQVALVRQKLAAQDTIELLRKIAKAHDRVRFLKRVVRSRKKRGLDASGPERALRNKLETLRELESG